MQPTMKIRCIAHGSERPVRKYFNQHGDVWRMDVSPETIYWWYDENQNRHVVTVEEGKDAPQFELVTNIPYRIDLVTMDTLKVSYTR